MKRNTAILIILFLTCSINVRAKTEPPFYKAEGEILFIMEGVGLDHLSLLSAYSRHVLGQESAIIELMNEGEVGLITPSAYDYLVPDASAAATALATGQKTRNGFVAKDPVGKDLYTVLDSAIRMKKSVGIVTDLAITGPVPASFYTNAFSYYDEVKIADLLADRVGITVMLGGGMASFLPKGTYIDRLTDINPIFAGISLRQDTANLWQKMGERGCYLVSEISKFNRLPKTVTNLCGLFTAAEFPYEIDRSGYSKNLLPPRLSDMVKAGWGLISKEPRGFFFLIEAGLVGYASHENDIGTVLRELLEIDRAVKFLKSEISAQKEKMGLLVITSTEVTGGPAFGYTNSFVPGSTKITAGMAYRPAFNFIPFEMLKKIGNQSRSLRSVIKRSGGSAAKLKEEVRVATGFDLSIEKLKAVFTKGGISGRPFFYVYDDDVPIVRLAHLLAEYTGVGWTGGTHLSTMVPAVAYGLNMEHFQGVMDNTQVGVILNKAFHGIPKGQ